MLNKIHKFAFFAMLAGVMMPFSSYAAMATDEVIDIETEMDDLSAAAIDEYEVEGSLFQQITDLEQEKVLMQLEKERAQLDLDLDRLAAEKIKLHMEIDALSGRAETQQQELETQMAKLEAEAARIAREKEALENATNDSSDVTTSTSSASSVSSISSSKSSDSGYADSKLGDKYKLVNVIGAGSQLQATIADLRTGQNKRISVGRALDGWTVKSISLDDGVVFYKDGETQTLNVTNSKTLGSANAGAK